MQIRTALLAMAATAALSTAAFAANPHDTNHPNSREELSDRCSTLESQYDRVIDGSQSASKLGRAEQLHATGVNECDMNESGLGAQKLEQSLLDLGVKPAA